MHALCFKTILWYLITWCFELISWIICLTIPHSSSAESTNSLSVSVCLSVSLPPSQRTCLSLLVINGSCLCACLEATAAESPAAHGNRTDLLLFPRQVNRQEGTLQAATCIYRWKTRIKYCTCVVVNFLNKIHI